MTRQILLRTPRGNTAVVPVDQYLRGSGGGDGDGEGGANPGTTKEGLLHQLIEASRRRDVGRKRAMEEDCEEEDENCPEEAFDDDDDGDDNGGLPRSAGDGEEDDPMMDDGHDWDQNDEEEEMSVATTGMAAEEEEDDDDETDNDGPDDITVRMRSTSITSIYERGDTLQPDFRCPCPPLPYGGGMSSSSRSLNHPTPQVVLYHQGRKVSLDRLWEWITGTPSSSAPAPAAAASATSSDPTTAGPPEFPLYLTLSTTVRLLGGIDRQNRVGSKFGGGGVSSSQQSERERKERLRQLALESIDLAKDPYLMRNHLGTYECKLCLTLHTNEANYLAHTQGKKHQQGLARRAHMEKLRAERQLQESGGPRQGPSSSSLHQQHQPPQKRLRIGRPAYQVFKSRDGDTGQRCLSFELGFPEIEEGLQPRHRFMSAFEQRVESPPDRRYQYLLFAADPYETVAFKIPNEPIDREPGRFLTHWDPDERKFVLTLYFVERDGGGGGDTNDNDVKDDGNNDDGHDGNRNDGVGGGRRVLDTTVDVKFGVAAIGGR
jgi:splicing factor 3A subunit 2